MRLKVLMVAVLSSMVALASCQSADDAMIALWLQNSMPNNTTDDDLNLDPSNVSPEAVTPLPKENKSDDKNTTECTTTNGQGGVCVTYYLCDQETKTVIEDGYSIIDVRFGTTCPKFLDVCCVRSQVMNKNETKATNNENVDVNEASFVAPVNHQIKNSLSKCGLSNPGVSLLTVRDLDVSNRIYADYGEFPWMVAVLKHTQKEDEWTKSNYVGGGSLIHPSVVMTVAHKLTKWKPADIKIRAGEYDTNSIDEEYDFQERDVDKIVIHQHYFRNSLYNDIGLLFLKNPVTLEGAPHIGVGCLGSQLPKPGTECFSMGWGAEDFNNKKVFASILKKVKLPLIESHNCETMLKATRLGPFFKLHESLTCAGGKAGVDTCRGDGGSALVCSVNSGGTRFAIYGMVAYGISCGQTNVPGVYVNVPNLYEWVGQQLTNEGYNTKSYVLT